MENILSGKESRIVHIAGDSFLLDFPYVRETHKLLLSLLDDKASEIWTALTGKYGVVVQRETRNLVESGQAEFPSEILEWIDHPFVMTHVRRSGEISLVYSSAMSASQKGKWGFGKNDVAASCPNPTELVPKNDDLPIWFRPVLIPLQKNKPLFDLANFMRDNPDGTIIRGGGLYIYDQFRQPGDWFLRPPTSCFRLDEAPDESQALGWSVVRGTRHLRTNLCKVFPSEVLPLFGQI